MRPAPPANIRELIDVWLLPFNGGGSGHSVGSILDWLPGPASPGTQWCERWSAGDVDLVADVVHADGHPGCADGRVVFGPGADVTGQGHGVPAGVDEHVT